MWSLCPSHVNIKQLSYTSPELKSQQNVPCVSNTIHSFGSTIPPHHLEVKTLLTVANVKWSLWGVINKLPAHRWPRASSQGMDAHCRGPGSPASFGCWRAWVPSSPRRPGCCSSVPTHKHNHPINQQTDMGFCSVELKVDKNVQCQILALKHINC